MPGQTRHPQLSAILGALGGQWAGDGCLTYCPAHPNTRTAALSVTMSNQGRVLVHCFAGCAGREVMLALRDRGLLNQSGDCWRGPSATEHHASRSNDRERRQRAAAHLWRTSRFVGSSLAQTYLRLGRGIRGAPIPSTLRYHPAASHPSGRSRSFPAMIARVDDAQGGFLGVHRTYLAADGSGKAAVTPPRATLGPISGGAVRLGMPGEVLAVGEGIESSLAFSVMESVPAWAALSTSGMRRIELPSLPQASELIIAADHDEGGRAAAEDLARRARSEGRNVRIALPPKPGTDFNDVILKGDWNGPTG